MTKLKITLLNSLIGRQRKQRDTINALGLTSPGSFVVRKDTPQIRGMINKVSHMIKVEEIEEVL